MHRRASIHFAASLVCLIATACDPDMPNPDESAEDMGEDMGEDTGDAEDTEGSEPSDMPDDDVPPDVVPEPCSTWGEARECEDAMQVMGTQFCDGQPNAMTWGACLTSIECTPGDAVECFPGDETFAGLMQGCIMTDGVPHWDWEACNTPLVLSFSAAPIELLDSAAAFDIAGAGECLTTDWPAAENPWLAIDLDKSGAIEGGHELFGSGSLLDGHHAINGFAALAQLDANRDGKISAADARFDELLIWRDLDLDKRSLPHELTSLAEEGVQVLELGYAVGEQCDARGNCAREHAAFEFVSGSGARRQGQLVDVYLGCR